MPSGRSRLSRSSRYFSRSASGSKLRACVSVSADMTIPPCPHGLDEADLLSLPDRLLVAEVARFEQLGIPTELGRVAFRRDLTVGQHIAAVGHFEGGQHVLLDEQDGHAPLVGDA